jgi:hypothetical protein
MSSLHTPIQLKPLEIQELELNLGVNMDKMDETTKYPEGGMVTSKNKIKNYGRGFHADQYEKFQQIKPKTDLSIL